MNLFNYKRGFYFFSVVTFLMLISYLVIDYNSDNVEDILTLVNIESENCNIQSEPCDFMLGISKVRIISDKSIKYLKPFFIYVKTNNKSKINKIQVEFKMVGMDMGVNRFLLNKDLKSKNRPFWQGKALLPICVAGRADWYVEFSFFTKDSHYFLKLPIIVEQPGS